MSAVTSTPRINAVSVAVDIIQAFAPGVLPEVLGLTTTHLKHTHLRCKSRILRNHRDSPAKADVYNSLSPQSLVKVRVLLDSGRQRSYITHHLQRSLALPSLKQQKMLIKIFGLEREEERVCDVVKIRQRTVSGVGLELPFYSVAMICEPLIPRCLCTGSRARTGSGNRLCKTVSTRFGA